jgi:redox-sensitive bicupin YhaK (pirin superfamily)
VNREVRVVVVSRPRSITPGFDVGRILPSHLARTVGPWVFADHMGPVDLAAGEGLDIPPHPHIGLATVTYLYEGAVLHRDSLGSVQLIEPGAVNWMTAGAGIVHSERTPPDHRAVADRLHGLQTWVVLPEADQAGPPEFQHVAAEDLPVVELDGGSATVVVGEAWGARSPVETLGDPLLVDLRLERGAVLAQPSPADQLGVYVAAGRLEIGAEAVTTGQLAVLEPGDDLELAAGEATIAAILGGPPVTPPHMWWNFVSSDAGAIEDAKQRWFEDRFDPVPGETDRVPLP